MSMSQGTAKWYVIHTYSGYEALVKDSLEKLIENNNLSDTILDIKIPMEETIEEKNGYSHRARAFSAFVKILEGLQTEGE